MTFNQWKKAYPEAYELYKFLKDPKVCRENARILKEMPSWKRCFCEQYLIDKKVKKK